MTDDAKLLRDYAKHGSEAAFGELVARHVDLVYSAALRQVNGDRHLAQDVMQRVFVDLARRAGALTTDVVLGGWLYRHTGFTASKIVRSEQRRRVREQEAVNMNALHNQSDTDAAWRQVAPVLDEAMQRLGARDRDAIVLRYFERRDLRAVGMALGTNEDAAQKRVSRALEKLRAFLTRRGITFSAAMLATTLASQAVTAAPAGLAVSVTGAALAGAAAGGGITVTLLKLMSMTKIKFAVAATLVVVALPTPLLIQQQALAKARAEQSELLVRERGLAAETESAALTTNGDIAAQRDRDDLERLRREAAALRARISELATQAKRAAAPNPALKAGGTPIGETIRLSELRDAGQATPAALLQTQMWALLHGDTNRISQLMAFDPETDMLLVQRTLDELHKASAKGSKAFLAESPLAEIRILEEQPAEHNDRWIVHEFMTKGGEVEGRSRIRVRLTDVGWKLVIRIDGRPTQESLDGPP